MERSLKEEVMDKAKENDVQFVRLQFTDIFGVLKNVAIPVDQLPKALDGQIMFDGSSIDGFVRIEESDMYLKPDPDSFTLFPWRTGDGSVARLICDVYSSDGTLFEGCPRGVLKKALDEAASLGYTMYIGPEMEFFLFHTDERGKPSLETHDQGGYFDLSPIDHGENARRDIVITLREMGYCIEATHHEMAPGQHEIDLKYDEALKIADEVVTVRYVIRAIAQRHGLHATFMPKPLHGVNGSGMHYNQSLFFKGKNSFEDKHARMQLSSTALHYIAGLMRHAPALTALTNPTVNSYKRLIPGYQAPVYIAWSEKNRSALIRIPVERGEATRVELRSPDPTSNPYLAIAVMLKAGLDGIKQKVEPAPPVKFSVFELDEKMRQEYKIENLPETLEKAIAALCESDLVRSAIGKHIFNRFVETKLREWKRYQEQVHSWEIEEYLARF